MLHLLHEGRDVSTRLDQLRQMRAFLDAEITAELSREVAEIREHPAFLHACDLYDIAPDQVLLGVRRHDVTRVRHAATWLLSRAGVPQDVLARVFGYSRTALWNALQRVENDAAMKALLLGLEVAS